MTLAALAQQSDNSRYITGEWYEDEYRSGWYKEQYFDTQREQWAIECDRYCVDLMIAYTGLSRSAKILDLGSGVGHIMRTWQTRGYINVKGIEISQTAVRLSNNPNIHCGSVADMSMFKDKEFDLVCSVALLEHIDESILPRTIKEIVRVGHRQAHFVAHEKGDDPGHINIKTAEEWSIAITEHGGNSTLILPNVLDVRSPLYLSMPKDIMTHPVRGIM